MDLNTVHLSRDRIGAFDDLGLRSDSFSDSETSVSVGLPLRQYAHSGASDGPRELAKATTGVLSGGRFRFEGSRRIEAAEVVANALLCPGLFLEAALLSETPSFLIIVFAHPPLTLRESGVLQRRVSFVRREIERDSPGARRDLEGRVWRELEGEGTCACAAAS